MVDNRVQVSGQIGVMEINGLLIKTILSKNLTRDFYLEESLALDWMYPQLSPHGLIFQLHAKPIAELDTKTVQQDLAYWKKLTGELVGDWITDKTSVKEVCDFADRIYRAKDLTGFQGDAGFAKNEAAQKGFSKLRSSIAGLYVWRAEHARDSEERSQAQKCAELALRQAFALCPYLPESVYRYTKFLGDLNRPDDAFLAAKTALRIDPEEDYLHHLVQTLSKAD
jgi:hypothetical protein